jgi:hypothetical protein
MPSYGSVATLFNAIANSNANTNDIASMTAVGTNVIYDGRANANPCYFPNTGDIVRITATGFSDQS